MNLSQNLSAVLIRPAAIDSDTQDDEKKRENLCSEIFEEKLNKIDEEYNMFVAAVMEESGYTVADEVSNALAETSPYDENTNNLHAVIGFTRLVGCYPSNPGCQYQCPPPDSSEQEDNCDSSDTQSCADNFQFADKCLDTMETSKIQEFFAKKKKEMQHRMTKLVDQIKYYTEQTEKYQALKRNSLQEKCTVEAYALQACKNVQRVEMELMAIRACVCKCYGDCESSGHFCCKAKAGKIYQLQNRLESVQSEAIKKDFDLQMCRESENRLINGNNQLKSDIKYLISVVQDYGSQIGKIQWDVCKGEKPKDPPKPPPIPEVPPLIEEPSIIEVLPQPMPPVHPPPPNVHPPPEKPFPSCIPQPSPPSTTDCESPPEDEDEPQGTIPGAPGGFDVPVVEVDRSAMTISTQEDEDGEKEEKSEANTSETDDNEGHDRKDRDGANNTYVSEKDSSGDYDSPRDVSQHNEKKRCRNTCKCQHNQRKTGHETVSMHSPRTGNYAGIDSDAETTFHGDDRCCGQSKRKKRNSSNKKSSHKTRSCKSASSKAKSLKTSDVVQRLRSMHAHLSRSDSNILKTYQQQNINLTQVVNHLTMQLNATQAKLMQYHKNQEQLLAERADAEELASQISMLREQNCALMNQIANSRRKHSPMHDVTSQTDNRQCENHQSTTSNLTFTRRIENLETLISNLSIQNQSNYKDYQDYRNLMNSYRNDIRRCIQQLSKPAESFQLLGEPSDHSDEKEWVEFSKKALQIAREAKLAAERKEVALKMIQRERNIMLTENDNLKKKLDMYADVQKQFLDSYFGPELKSRVEQLSKEVAKYEDTIEKHEKEKKKLLERNEEVSNELESSKKRIKQLEEDVKFLVKTRAQEVSKLKQDYRRVLSELEAQKNERTKLSNQVKSSSHAINEYKSKLDKYEFDLTTAREIIEKLMDSHHQNGSHESSTEAVLRVDNEFDFPQRLHDRSFSQLRINSFHPSATSFKRREVSHASRKIDPPQPRQESIKSEIRKLNDSIRALQGNVNRTLFNESGCESRERDKQLQMICARVMERGIHALDFKALLYLHQAVYNAGIEVKKKLGNTSEPVRNAFARKPWSNEHEYRTKVARLHRIEEEIQKTQDILKYLQRNVKG